MASKTRATAKAAKPTEQARTTAPIRSAAVDPVPSVASPETSATTASRAVPRRVTVSNRRLADDHVGESFLVWRCLRCGETGSLTEFPSFCPSCFGDRESLFYWTED